MRTSSSSDYSHVVDKTFDVMLSPPATQEPGGGKPVKSLAKRTLRTPDISDPARHNPRLHDILDGIIKQYPINLVSSRVVETPKISPSQVLSDEISHMDATSLSTAMCIERANDLYQCFPDAVRISTQSIARQREARIMSTSRIERGRERTTAGTKNAEKYDTNGQRCGADFVQDVWSTHAETPAWWRSVQIETFRPGHREGQTSSPSHNVEFPIAELAVGGLRDQRHHTHTGLPSSSILPHSAISFLPFEDQSRRGRDRPAFSPDPYLPPWAFEELGSTHDDANNREAELFTQLSPNLNRIAYPKRNKPNHNMKAGHRDTSRDEFLLQCKAKGMTYKEIKELGGFAEAESTLRGRYRTLTKPREERLRKPEWTGRDVGMYRQQVTELSFGQVELLFEAVSRYAHAHSVLRHRDHLDSTTLDHFANTIPWKQVADFMAHRGSYRYGNATVKKKYMEVLNEQSNALHLRCGRW